MKNIMNNDKYNFLINLLNEELTRLESSYNKIKINIDNCTKDKNIYSNIIDKLKRREVLTDNEIEFLKQDDNINKVGDLDLVIKNILFIKQMEEFLNINSNVDKSFKEQFINIKEILDNVIKILNNKNDSYRIGIYKKFKKYEEEFKIVGNHIENVNNILNYLLGNTTILKEDSYRYLIELLKINKDLSNSDKKNIFLELATYIFKQVEKKKESLKNLKSDILVYDVEEKTKELFSDYIIEEVQQDNQEKEIKEVETIESTIVNEEELEEKRKKLYSLVKEVFDYLNVIYDIANQYNIDLELNIKKEIENKFKATYSLILENFKEPVNIKETIENVNAIIRDEHNLFKNYIFNETFILYNILKSEYSYLFDLYIKINNNLDDFIKSLIDIEQIDEYITLFEDSVKFLKDANINEEQEKFKYIYSNLYPEKDEPEHSLSNILENVILFTDKTIEDSISRNTNQGSTTEFSTHLKTGLRLMKEKNYGVLGQGNNARDQRLANIKDSNKCGITSALVKSGIDAKRFRHGNARIAFIPLNISNAVKEFIMEYFKCNLNNNNRVLLVFGFDYKCSSDEETYAIFNNYLGKKDKSSKSYQINKNRDVFDIFDLFAKTELTKEDIDKIIHIVQSSSKRFSSIVEDDLSLVLS